MQMIMIAQINTDIQQALNKNYIIVFLLNHSQPFDKESIINTFLLTNVKLTIFKKNDF